MRSYSPFINYDKFAWDTIGLVLDNGANEEEDSYEEEDNKADR